MNEAQSAVPGLAAQSGGEEISLLDMMIGLAKHKKMILGLPIAAAVIATAISLALPNVYRSTTVLLPPQQPQSGASALLAQLGGAAGAAASIAGMKNPNDLYVGMLKSRTVADRVIAKFNLKNVYDTSSDEIARKRLETNTVVTSGKDGLISVEVEDGNQKLVALLANAYVEELLRLTRVLAVTEAAQRRMFFERQLELAKNNLAKAEVALKGALETQGVVSVDGESRGVVETIARLRAQVSAKTIELNSMQAFVTTANPAYRRVAEEISSLRGELSKLENGSGSATAAPAVDSKRGGLENVQRMRDLKYYQMMYELLAKQYEAARLDEAKDPSIIQVLDPAVSPERHVRPKRVIMVLIAALGAMLIGILWAFFAEAKSKALRQPRVVAQWNELKNSLRKK